MLTHLPAPVLVMYYFLKKTTFINLSPGILVYSVSTTTITVIDCEPVLWCPIRTICDSNAPALVEIPQGHCIALLGGHNSHSPGIVLTFHIRVVSWIVCLQLVVDYGVLAVGVKSIGQAASTVRFVFP